MTKILIFTNYGMKAYKHKMAYQPLYHLEEELINSSLFEVIRVNYPEIKTDAGVWMGKNGIENVHTFDYIFFPILSYAHIKESIDLLDNIHSIKIKKIVYLIDYWKYDQKNIDFYLKKIDPEIIFYAYYDNKSDISKKYKYSKAYWLPLAESNKIFNITNLKKTKHFIQFGRKNLNDFKTIKNICLKNNLQLTDLSNHSLINKLNPFSFHYKRLNPRELSKAIEKHYFGLVSYSSLENSHLLGNISPITPRFYQVMLSGALPVGKMPNKEFNLLFDKNIKAVELQNIYNYDFKQLRAYLDDIDLYKNTVLNNYNHINQYHTWKNRVNTIALNLIGEKCYYQQ